MSSEETMRKMRKADKLSENLAVTGLKYELGLISPDFQPHRSQTENPLLLMVKKS